MGLLGLSVITTTLNVCTAKGATQWFYTRVQPRSRHPALGLDFRYSRRLLRASSQSAHSHCSANLGTCLQQNGFGWPPGGPPWCLGLSYYWRDGRTQHHAGTEIWGVKKVNNVGTVGVNRACPCLPLYLDPQPLSRCQSSEALSQSFGWELGGGAPLCQNRPRPTQPLLRVYQPQDTMRRAGVGGELRLSGGPGCAFLEDGSQSRLVGVQCLPSTAVKPVRAGSCPKGPSGASEPAPPDSPPSTQPSSIGREGTTPANPP